MVIFASMLVKYWHFLPAIMPLKYRWIFNAGIKITDDPSRCHNYTCKIWKLLIFQVEISQSEQQRLKKEVLRPRPAGYENEKRTEIL